MISNRSHLTVSHLEWYNLPTMMAATGEESNSHFVLSGPKW